MEWKDVIGFEGLYQVNQFGDIKSLGNGLSTNSLNNKERILKPQKKRYLTVKLSKDGNYYYKTIHRLVAEAFIENKENKPQVNHIDGNKYNNHVNNLEWNTAKENIQHSVRTGLQINKKGLENTCSKQILQYDLDNNLIKEWGSLREITRETGFNRTGIVGCCKKRKKFRTAYGYQWEYKK
jgi:hypothetical protein